MRVTFTFCLVLTFACAGFAKEPKAYETGKLVQMESVRCGTSGNEESSTFVEMPIRDASSKRTDEVIICREYVLESERVIYRIRPRDKKHGVLLPIGDRAQFRFKADKLILRLEARDSKEREYVVVSMNPKTENSTADASPVRMNHLQ